MEGGWRVKVALWIMPSRVRLPGIQSQLCLSLMM